MITFPACMYINEWPALEPLASLFHVSYIFTYESLEVSFSYPIGYEFGYPIPPIDDILHDFMGFHDPSLDTI